jgi:hypothetical protein
MTDIVYILGNGSKWQNNEIRYSLRSYFKHLTGIGKVFIVGHDPGIFKDVIHIPYQDKYAKNKARNIYEKILAACNDERVSDDFLCSSDDTFLLADNNLDNFPYYYCGCLRDTYERLSKESKYRAYVEITLSVLLSKDLPTKNFNGHTPIVYNKEKFKQVMGRYNWELPKSYISKSLYCNTLRIEGTILPDKKIFRPMISKAAIMRRIRYSPVFSIENESVNGFMEEVLDELYPDASPLEL